MNPIIYNIPASRLRDYPEHPLILRTAEPAEIRELLSDDFLDRLVYLQLLSLESVDAESAHWPEGMPLDVYMPQPERDFASLYHVSRLLDRHPVRVSMPTVPGFGKAVKLTTSLNFAVKLLVEQPDGPQIAELSQVLDLYLHQSTSAQPVEFFHSLLLAMYHKKPATLWGIQEEDPAYNHYIAENDEEYLSARFADRNLPLGEGSAFIEAFKQQRLAERGECSACGFFEHCAGYFKWPEPAYSCKGIKGIFSQIRDASQQLAEALNDFERKSGPSV